MNIFISAVYCFLLRTQLILLHAAYDVQVPNLVAQSVEPGYNDICLYDTSSIASDILWYQLIPHYEP
jgi:hypothetical protein